MKMQMNKDLQKNFSARLNRLVADTLDTCKHGNLNREEAFSIVFVGVVHGAVEIAQAVGLGEEEFMGFVRGHFQAMEDKE
jgi:hypothetical protein